MLVSLPSDNGGRTLYSSPKDTIPQTGGDSLRRVKSALLCECYYTTTYYSVTSLLSLSLSFSLLTTYLDFSTHNPVSIASVISPPSAFFFISLTFLAMTLFLLVLPHTMREREIPDRVFWHFPYYVLRAIYRLEDISCGKEPQGW